MNRKLPLFDAVIVLSALPCFVLFGCNAGTNVRLDPNGATAQRLPFDSITTNRDSDRTSIVTSGIPNQTTIADGTVEDTSGTLKSLAAVTPDGQLVLNDTGDVRLDSLKVTWALNEEGTPYPQTVELVGFVRNHSDLAARLGERLAFHVDAIKSMSAAQAQVYVEGIKAVDPILGTALEGLFKILFPTP